jgi:uncharacterized tellurite resistance protein B-like protein
MMSETIFERISAYLSKKTAVQRLSEDPALVSELLLLVRLVFADGQKDPAEMNALLHIMQHEFDIKPEELPEVADYLKTYAYETTSTQAAALFNEMVPERRYSLVGHLLTIAKADNEIHPAESALISRVIEQLNVTPDELFERRQNIGQNNN